jgi:hypothetical protein
MDSLPDGQIPVNMQGAMGQNDLRTTTANVVTLVLGFLGILTVMAIPVGVVLGIVFLTKKEEPVVSGAPVEVKTAPSVKYAGFWLRVVAYIIDAIVVYIGTQIVASIVMMGYQPSSRGGKYLGGGLSALGCIMP